MHLPCGPALRALRVHARRASRRRGVARVRPACDHPRRGRPHADAPTRSPRSRRR